MVQVPFGPELQVENELENYWREVQSQRDQVLIGDRTYKADDPPREHFDIFVSEMSILAKRQRHPLVADIFARGARFVWDAVRLVNDQTKQGFEGSKSRGAELLFNPFILRDTGSAGEFPGTNPSTTWTIIRTASGAARLYPSANTIDLLISSLPVMSHVILGFINPVEVPKSESIQLVYNDPWAEEAFDWEYREALDGSELPIYELKQPWVIAPGDSYRVNIRYALTGDDKTQPIGFTVKRAQDLNASSAIAS